MAFPSRRSVVVAAAVASSLALAGCGGMSLESQLASAEAIPLWQTVTAIALSTLISEDLACISAGLLASEGVLPLRWAVTGAFLGIFLGDVLLYVIGRVGGLGMLRRRPLRWLIKENQVIQAQTLFTEHGAKLIFSSRVLPGSRLPIYAAAGVLNYPFWKFCLFMSLAGGLSAVILTTLSLWLGEAIMEWLLVYEKYALYLLAAVAVGAWLVLKLLEILATKRSRLVFVARCRKALNKARELAGRAPLTRRGR